MKNNLLEFDITSIIDDTEYHMIENNLEKYFNIEIEHLKGIGIKILNTNIDDLTIEIEDCHDIENKKLYKNIPCNYYNWEKIEKEKSYKHDDDNYNLSLILSYFKEKGIKHGDIKKNLIEFCCPICHKTNFKCFMFFNSFYSMSHSKTDCCDEKHKEFFKKMQNDLKTKVKENLDLDKLYIKWNTDYVDVEYINESGKKIKTSLSKYFKEYKIDDFRPEIKKTTVTICIENIKKLLEHYSIEIKFNLITKDFNIYQFGNLSRYNLEYWLTKIHNFLDIRKLRIAREKLKHIICSMGLDKECNPWSEYLEKNYENNKNNISEFEFNKLVSCIDSNSDNISQKLQRFLLQSVYLGCRNEYSDDNLKAEFLLMLQGKQGGGKTSFAEYLLPKTLKSLFYEAKHVDVNNKDKIFENATKIMVELGEIHSTFKKSDVDSFKAYITSIYDLIRRPYDKELTKMKRRVTFIGTTNNTDYIQDYTGNRRFVCINDMVVQLENLKTVDMDLVWCYIYELYLKKERYWYTDVEIKELMIENNQHMYKVEGYIILEKYLDLLPDDSTEPKRVKDIWNYLNSKFEIEEKFHIPSYMKLTQLLKKYNIKFKYDSKNKSNLWYVEFNKNYKF